MFYCRVPVLRMLGCWWTGWLSSGGIHCLNKCWQINELFFRNFIAKRSIRKPKMKNFPHKVITLSDSDLPDQNRFKLMAEEFINRFNLWKSEEGNERGKGIFIWNSEEFASEFYKNLVKLLTLGEKSTRSFSTQNP